MANMKFAKKQKQLEQKLQSYKVLIVDDDQAIHEVTNMAIESISFLEFNLEVFNTYSAKEAKDILHKHPDMALAIVDVVMETPEAGLDLVNYIRNDLKNSLIRLMIRTGQANEFPEIDVIRKYDINDFKNKTELSIEKLYIAIRTSIQQFIQLMQLKTTHLENEKLLEETVEEKTLRLKVANKNLLKSEEKYRLLFELSEDPMWIIYENKFILANNAAISSVGYASQEEFRKIHPGAVSPKYQENGRLSEDLANEMMETAFTKGYHRFEWLHQKKNGDTFPVEVSLTKIPFEDSQGLFCIWRDITQQKEYQQNIITAYEEAEKANETKSNFLANMSHEIRTPLNAILGFVDLLKEEKEKEKTKEYLNIIDESSKGLLQIIEDILDFSKIESGKLEIDTIDFNPRYQLSVVSHLFQAKCSEKGISLSVLFGDNIPKAIHSDPLRIKQIIANLISNAVKFTSSGKNITINVSYEKSKLTISVQDEGKGIKSERLEHIFSAFEQEDSSTTREYGGTGLGLSISAELVKLLGGELKVQSQYGQGSDFYFSIPAEEVDEIVESTADIRHIDFKDKKLLLVEDNHANQTFMKVIFKKMNIAYDISHDGEEALLMFKKNTYDAILMDENMPNMNGIMATQEIINIEQEKKLKHTPIIALTANALKGDREKFLSAGMDEYMTKPVNKDKLATVLMNFFKVV